MNILKINGQALEGIYVDAAISFNKPAKRVSTYSVPGRNGDLVIDEGTFDNVLITYPVFEKSTFPTEFDEIVNKLAALEGYQRIECSNDPQHYRLGRFVVPQNPTAKRLNRDGYWQLSFDCKPQRWLLSGEEDTEIDANPIAEYSGDIVSFDAVALDEITELKAAIEPIQSGTGDPSPTNVRPISGHTEVNVTRTGKNLWNPEAVKNGYYDISTGAFVASANWRASELIPALPNTDYSNSGFNTTNGWPSGYALAFDSNKIVLQSWTSVLTFTTPANTAYIALYTGRSTLENATPQVEKGSSPTAYEPYNGTTYNIPLGQTVYGGTLNVTTGELTVESIFREFDGTEDPSIIKQVGSTSGLVRFNASAFGNYAVRNTQSGSIANTNNVKSNMLVVSTVGAWTSAPVGGFGVITGIPWIKPQDEAFADAAAVLAWMAQQKAAGTPLQVMLELATPTTVQLTPTQVSTLLGANNIWADAGEVEVKVTSPTVFNNPSLFNSKPLIRVYGIGTFRVNDITVTIASHDKPYIDIDCELQECFYEGENMNEYVSFSGNDFPELQPGDNYMLLASGITKLDITPRWWIL